MYDQFLVSVDLDFFMCSVVACSYTLIYSLIVLNGLDFVCFMDEH